MDLILRTHIRGAINFCWGEAVYLPDWRIHAFPTRDVRVNIHIFAPKVQLVREFLGVPMTIINWWRPPEYNTHIGGATLSQHMYGKAIDFKCKDMSADEVRSTLEPRLEQFGLRMENLPGSDWVHIDDGIVNYQRYFKP